MQSACIDIIDDSSVVAGSEEDGNDARDREGGADKCCDRFLEEC